MSSDMKSNDITNKNVVVAGKKNLPVSSYHFNLLREDVRDLKLGGEERLYETSAAITAYAGGGQTSATQLTAEVNNVTVVATDFDSVKLPAAVAGARVVVKNSDSAQILAVFPSASDSIDALAVNLAVSVMPGSVVTFYAKDATVWESDTDSITLNSPSTAKGEMVIKMTDNSGDFTTTVTNAAQGADATYQIPGSGSGFFGVSTAALSLAEMDVLDAAGTGGTAVANKVVVADANQNIGDIYGTSLSLGVSGTEYDISPYRNVGSMASGYVDFNATGTAAMNITINGVVYLEADAEDFPNGVWTNGASAADSATSLISAINGDTRATVPFTAVADLSGDGVMLFWDAVGTAGNVVITSSDGSATTANSVGGAAAAVKQTLHVTKTATTNELLSGTIEIPVPFVPTKVNINVYTSTGAPVYFTDLVTIQAAPNRIRIDTDGATNIGNTDVIHLWVTE